MTNREFRKLRHLARLHGIQTCYLDVASERCEVSADTLLRTLQVYGVDIEGPAELDVAIHKRRQELAARVLEPVTVAWEGQAIVKITLPAERAKEKLAARLTLEDGAEKSFTSDLANQPQRHRATLDGTKYVSLKYELPERLPHGYHRLQVEAGGQQHETLLLSAPVEAYQHKEHGAQRMWGVFVPLYALHGEGSWGAGDFGDLEALIRYISDHGGSLVATLPLLAWLAELNDDPSPYSPTSRLFWNDFYIDIERIPEFADCPAAQQITAAAETKQEIAALQKAEFVDYPRQMKLKRRVLEALSAYFFSLENNSPRRAALNAFLEENPDLETFARFRAVGEKQGCHWLDWPERLQHGPLQETDVRQDDYDQAVFQYHLYVQWQVQEQLQSLSDAARANDLVWYLDFPLGVSGAGYYVWQQGDVFARGASGGAPPDAFFTKGQNWGFPPLHPERLRADGYSYLIDSLRRHLRYARLLRIDHAMCLYRLYWVPQGVDAQEGTYVRYAVDELCAILCIESHRHAAQIVGENLGTVPPQVDEALARHKIQDMYVVQYETQPDPDEPLRKVPASSVASLNTHDMPMFTAFWTALDVDDRVDLELLSPAEATAERDRRALERQAIVQFLQQRGFLKQNTLDPHLVRSALLRWLCSSSAPVVLANLEDFWSESRPQNTPGTWNERINWRKKTRFTLEELCRLPDVINLLSQMDACRRGNTT